MCPWCLLSVGRAPNTSLGRPFWRYLDQFPEPPLLNVESPPLGLLTVSLRDSPDSLTGLLVSAILFVLSLLTACDQRSPLHSVSICPSLLNNTLRYLNSSTQSHSPARRKLHPFPARDRGLCIKILLPPVQP